MARPTKVKQHIFDTRSELIWLMDKEGYDGEEIGIIFGKDRSVINRTLKKKPYNWRPRWRKA